MGAGSVTLSHIGTIDIDNGAGGITVAGVAGAGVVMVVNPTTHHRERPG